MRGGGGARGPRWADIAFVLVPIGIIGVAIWRLALPIGYPPGDIRSEPWFNPVTSGILILAALVFLIVGLVRLASRHGE